MKRMMSGMFLAIGLLLGCYTTISRKTDEWDAGKTCSDDPENVYRAVKSRWTVVLESGKIAGPSPMRMSGSGSGGPRSGGIFPLSVTATLMNREVVEAGLRCYSSMAAMSREEFDSFRQTYMDRYKIDENILIEASVGTILAENYLDFSRYAIYLEDDQKNQQPVTRIEEAAFPDERIVEMIWDPAGSGPGFVESGMHQKRILLFFPGTGFYGNPTIREGIEFLKLVFRLEVDGSAQGEGMWFF